MKIRTERSPRGEKGFSLVELLLTLVLILCLAAASVFTFTAIYQSANLDEGSDRFQSLVRFAQAEAATTGRKVRLQFVPAVPVETQVTTEATTELRAIKVTWEADLLNAPGVFQDYTNKAWSEEIVNELVGVEKVQPIQSPNAPPAQETAMPLAGETADASALEEDFPSITFYPDGSCDSAEIVLASRNSDDDRRLAVRLSGLLGSVSTRTLDSDLNASAAASIDSGEPALEEDGTFEGDPASQDDFAD